MTTKEDRWKAPRPASPTPSQVRILDRLDADVAAGHRYPPSAEALRRMMATAARDDDRPTEEQRRALFATANQCGITRRRDRLDFTELILERDVASWSDLTAGDVRRLFDALHGFAATASFHIAEGRRWRYGRCPRAGDCPMLNPE